MMESSINNFLSDGKKKLCLSFSMGETSAFMTEWCLHNLKDEYDMVVVCANTGDEHEESLIFGDKCDKFFGWNMVWVECVTNPEFQKGVKAKVVEFETASRNGEPFEQMIAKHGIPNRNFPHCSRELKSYTIKAYLRNQLGWTGYETAIGIRADEPERIDWKKAKANKLLYPLVSKVRMTKPRINLFWSRKPFRLNIKSYEGNCKSCWKKSNRKLMTLASETPNSFDFFRLMETKYGNYQPDHREKEIELPIKFFRGNNTVYDIFEEAKFPFTPALDERLLTHIQTDFWEEELDGNFGCTESCEAFLED